jgi:hypothetical protein
VIFVTDHQVEGAHDCSSKRSRPGATSGYTIAYIVTLVSLIVVWFRHLRYLGRDADLSLGLNKACLD